METRTKAAHVDSEILSFMEDILTAVLTWDSFHFPLKENGYAYLDVQQLEKKHGFQFLDRIFLIDDDGNKQRGTVVGQREGQLYINLDNRFYAQAVPRNEKKPLPLVKDSSRITDFESVEAFQHVYLGFYLLTHNQYIKQLNFQQRNTGFKNNFWACMERNEIYFKSTKIIEKTLPRLKFRQK